MLGNHFVHIYTCLLPTQQVLQWLVVTNLIEMRDKRYLSMKQLNYNVLHIVTVNR